MIKKLIFVTGNKSKFEDAKELLSRYNIDVIQNKLDLIEPRAETTKEVAIEKAEQVKKILSVPFIVEDSGFFVPSLNGFPGVFVNYMLHTIGIEGLVKLLEGKDKKGIFKMTLAFCDENKSVKTFDFEVNGKIIPPKGERARWSDLFKIFMPEGFSKTLGEMSEVEYKDYSEDWLEHSHFKKLAEHLVKK